MAETIVAGHLSGDGALTKRCQHLIECTLGCTLALLTHSCTAALEIAGLLCDLKPDDEVIMPSFTFASTANAVVLRGATPVFVDIRPDTLNIDENLIEDAITPRTKAIFVVHYAGVACEMDKIQEIARRHHLVVVEDAAQAILSRYKGRFLGTLGEIGALSFHETKNIISGEGGAILINSDLYRDRAEIIRNKGTNRAMFSRGKIDKYTWIDVGSSYLPSEIIAAFLFAQLEQATALTERRKQIWTCYHEALDEYEAAGQLRRPVVPNNCDHNGHLYYILMPDSESRTRLIDGFKKMGINAPFHYVPLHSSPAGMCFGRAHGSLPITDRAGNCLVRLPMWLGVEPQLYQVIDAMHAIIAK